MDYHIFRKLKTAKKFINGIITTVETGKEFKKPVKVVTTVSKPNRISVHFLH